MSLAPRRTLLSLLVAGAALAPSIALAQPLGGGALDVQIELPTGEPGEFDFATEERLEGFFNAAHCDCAQALPDEDASRFQVELSFTMPPADQSDSRVQLWVGSNCETDVLADRLMTCTQSPGDFDIDDIRQIVRRTFSVADLLDPTATGSCPAVSEQRNVYTAIVVADQFEETVTTPILVDTRLPPIPPEFNRAAGGENAIVLDWDLPESDLEDVQFWQVLCARADGTPALASVPGNLSPRWSTPEQVCGVETAPVVELVEAPTPATPGADASDAEVPDLANLPGPLLDLDPRYLCAEAPSTASSIRVGGLDNGEPYYFVLVAVDDFENPHGATSGVSVTPRPVTDFWEDVDDGGEGPDGGFCLIADTYGDRGGPGGALTEALRGFRDDTLAASAAGRWLIDAYYEAGAPLAELARQSLAARVILAIILLPVAALALAWHALGLPALLAAIALVAWRRPLARAARRLAPRARLALTGAAALAVVGVAPAVAGAQTFAPYWEDAAAETAVDVDPAQINWHFGVKLGPYLPSIDEGLGEDPGPYERFFNERSTKEALPVVELDWLFWKPPGGQLGVGLSAGVMGKSGRAFTSEGMRSDGDYTRFRMVPVAATLIYRLTALDDEYGIPIVPYVRGGLSYYVWWVLAPSGNLARSYPCDVDAGEMCTADTAIGASAGAQGSIGIAIRAEDIDASAAQSMRLTGLYHAGFYVEASLAWVDGFGNDKKLSLGDTTWFAGINFEF